MVFACPRANLRRPKRAVRVAVIRPCGSSLAVCFFIDWVQYPLEMSFSYGSVRADGTDGAEGASCALAFSYHAFNTATVGPRNTIANTSLTAVGL